ncbi:MAG TPA: Cys-Gln thioester bond-forming surface protein [Phycisphaerales bacterium]|nr:Cys-Gln thioester bond-forming surface protein [Phycisphaerales bacterium]
MKKGSFVVAALFAAFVASNASADFANVKYVGTGKGSNVKMTIGGTTKDVFAGQLKHQISGATGDYAVLNGTKVTFCTDLLQYVSSSTTQYEFVPVSSVPMSAPMGADKAKAIQDMYNGASGAQLASNVSDDFATAFQLAVWEVVTDYNKNVGVASVGLASGQFKAKKTNGNALSSGVMNAFNTLIGYIGQASNNNVKIVGMANNHAQDQIVEGQTYVPAPGAAALASLGLLLAGKRRRK